MATTIQSLIDQRIAEFQAQKQTIDTQISILQQQGVEYGADPIIELWSVRDSSSFGDKIIVTNLSQFPLVYFRYLVKTDVSASDLTNQLVSKLPYEEFIAIFPTQ